MSDRIDEILNQRRKVEKPVETAPPEEDKFFSILVGEGTQEHFLELQHANGLQTCFSYDDLSWFVHDPEVGAIDLAFGGFAITIKGRGLQRLFLGIKQKRVAWVKEADQDLQDHSGNPTFVSEISIAPPEGFGVEAPADDESGNDDQ